MGATFFTCVFHMPRMMRKHGGCGCTCRCSCSPAWWHAPRVAVIRCKIRPNSRCASMPAYACQAYQTKKDSLSQPATAARNLPYEPGATSQNQERIPRHFRQRFHDVSIPNVINESNDLCHSINL